MKMFRCLKRLFTEIRGVVFPPKCNASFICSEFMLGFELESSGKASIDLVLRPLLEC